MGADFECLALAAGFVLHSSLVHATSRPNGRAKHVPISLAPSPQANNMPTQTTDTVSPFCSSPCRPLRMRRCRRQSGDDPWAFRLISSAPKLQHVCLLPKAHWQLCPWPLE